MFVFLCSNTTHMSTNRAQVRTRLRKDVLEAIEHIAAEQNRTVANFIETELIMIAKRHGYVFGKTDSTAHNPIASIQQQPRNPNEDLL